jgi:staphylococcal nuclease domain-containing protein 1
MKEFSQYHKTVAPTAGFVPKSNDLVSAKFSDGQWYRARVRRVSAVKKEAEVTFIDYGNQDTVGFSDIRPLDPRFRSLPGQAHDARLRSRVQNVCVIWVKANILSSTASSSSLDQRANTMQMQ